MKKYKVSLFKKIFLGSILVAGIIYFISNCKTTPTASEHDSYGSIQVNSDPVQAEIYINGEFTGKYTNHFFHHMSVDLYTIALKRRCYKDFEISINVQENQIVTINAILERESPEGYTVSGTVYYSTTPMDGIKVELHEGSKDGPLIQTVWTNKGSYDFSSLFPRSYSIKAYAPTDEYIEWSVLIFVLYCNNVEHDLYLCKKLILTWPKNGSTVNTKYPTLSWEANREAIKYSIRLFETLGNHTVVDELNCTSTSYTVKKALISGMHYNAVVKAWDTQDNLVAEGQVKFTVSQNKRI